MPAKSPDKIEDLHKLYGGQLVQDPYDTIRSDRVAVKFRGKPPKWQTTPGSSKHRYNEGTLKMNVTAVVMQKYSNVDC